MRGSLIQRFQAEIRRLDTVATAAAGGYDDTFRQVLRNDVDGDGIGDPKRSEKAAELVPCQIDRPGFREAKRLTMMGYSPDVELILVFHFEDLERLSLVDANGETMIRTGTRLLSIKDINGNTVRTLTTPLYATWTDDSGWGLDITSPTRNLLLVGFDPREKTK